MLSIDERVKNGAEFLDEAKPGWEQEIDVSALDVFDGSRCILGQLHGGYLRGLEKTGLLGNYDACVDRGFTTGDDNEWEELTFAWSTRISERVNV
jgi:hypothetical protein